MNEIMVLFSLGATGCLVRLSTDLVLQAFARRLPSGTIVTGPHQSDDSPQKADPLMTLSLTIGCYGAIALALVAELPGDLAFQRTWLSFALLCVGGLIGEISRAGANSAQGDDGDDVEPEDCTPTSVGLSVALMLALNLAISILISGQGLVQIVPPPAPANTDQTTQLEQIVVVARRSPADATNPSFL